MKFPMDTDIHGGDLVGESLVINILKGQQLIRFRGVDPPSADIGKNLNGRILAPLATPFRVGPPLLAAIMPEI